MSSSGAKPKTATPKVTAAPKAPAQKKQESSSSEESSSDSEDEAPKKVRFRLQILLDISFAHLDESHSFLRRDFCPGSAV